MMSQGTMTPPKEPNKHPVTDPKEMDIHKLPGKDFKIIVLKELKRAIREHRLTFLTKSIIKYKRKMRSSTKKTLNRIAFLS